MSSILSLASLLLPEGMLEHFVIVSICEATNLKTKKGEDHIELDEKNNLPSKYKDYESKGFLARKHVQDFPVRGKGLHLHIRRRRWRDKHGHKPDIKSDYSFIAKGVMLTDELAHFLKDGSPN